MKKILLSLSFVAAVMSANAQSKLVGSGAYDDVNSVVEFNVPADNSGIYWWASECFPQFPNFGAASTSPVITDGVKRRENGEIAISVDKTQTTNSGTTDCAGADAAYVPFGLNFGDDNGATAGGNPYYIDISANKTISFKMKASAAVVVRLQLEDVNKVKIEGTQAVYGSEYAFNVTTAYQTFTQNLTGGVGFQHSGCPGGTNPCAITGFDYTKVAKIMFFVDPGNSGTGAFNGTVYVDDLKVGTTNNIGLATQSALANIGSTKLFPNPTEGSFTTEVNLKSAASVSVIVTDMTGRQVASKNLGTITTGSEVFNTADLAKGMYTVTYVLDGTPAKSELVVVR